MTHLRFCIALLVAGFSLTVSAPTRPASAAASPTATATPIKHFISIMQEQHSFDSYFGTYPNARGIPAHICLPASHATGAHEACVTPFAIGTRSSRGLVDTRSAFEASYAGGAMDGFVVAQSKRGITNDLAMAHYVADDLPYYWSLADNYVLFDNYFASAAGGSLWNRMYWVAGGPGNPYAEVVPKAGFGNVETVFDRLQAKGVSWKFYIQDYDPKLTFRTAGALPRQVEQAPLLAIARFIDEKTLAQHIAPLSDYYADLANDSLPAVSYIVAAGSSERPPANVANGQAFVRNIVAALKRSNSWASSALMLSYADWGGWYDHVKPPAVDSLGLGFRVPALLVSPYARVGLVDHDQLEHASILAFIEHNWGIPPLTTRDARAGDFIDAFDFGRSPRTPHLEIESGVPHNVPAGSQGIIYPAYGLVLLTATGAFGAALFNDRRKHRNRVIR